MESEKLDVLSSAWGAIPIVLPADQTGNVEHDEFIILMPTHGKVGWVSVGKGLNECRWELEKLHTPLGSLAAVIVSIIDKLRGNVTTFKFKNGNDLTNKVLGVLHTADTTILKILDPNDACLLELHTVTSSLPGYVKEYVVVPKTYLNWGAKNALDVVWESIKDW